MEANRKLYELIDKTWKHYNDMKKNDYVIKKSIPILFFGDYSKYINSELKIVTVGLNPSHHEFPVNSGERFKNIDELYNNYTGSKDHNEQYIKTLSNYFSYNPYKKWFDNACECVLNGMDCSYYENKNKSNVALHTDLFSPIATDPVWSALKKKLKKEYSHELLNLSKPGLEIWHELIEILAPDVILYSNSKTYLDLVDIGNFNKDNNTEFFELVRENKRNHIIKDQLLSLESGKETYFIIAPGGRKPFGNLLSEEREIIGNEIIRRISR